MSWSDTLSGWDRTIGILRSQTTDSQIDTYTANFNRAIIAYTNNAGISPNPSVNQAILDANQAISNLTANEQAYHDIIAQVTAKIKTITTNSDVRGRLNTIGTLGGDVRNLQKTLNNAISDANTSQTRKDSVENPDTKVSWYQGFASRVGFTKPLRQVSIPILIGFGILLLILSGLMLKEVFGSEYGQPTQYVDSDGLFALFTDSRLYSVLGAITLVIVVLGILSYNGYMGKYTL